MSHRTPHSLGFVAGAVRVDAERMRAATAGFIDAIHRSYTQETQSLPPGIRGRLPLAAGGPFEVAAVGLRNLHVLATRDRLETCGDESLIVAGSKPPLSWTLRFYDAGVLPALRDLDESETPAIDGVRRALGIGTTLYHLVLQEGASLTPHSAEHAGLGLANSHTAALTDFATMRGLVGDRGDLVDEMEVAATSGLAHCQRLLATALVPDDTQVTELAAAQPLEPVKLRRAVLTALRGIGQVTP